MSHERTIEINLHQVTLSNFKDKAILNTRIGVGKEKLLPERNVMK